MTARSKKPARIVSLTPLPLASDSRTLKIARSFALSGCKSTVVENRKSPSDWKPDLVSLISLDSYGGQRIQTTSEIKSIHVNSHEDAPTVIKKKIREFFPRLLREITHFLTFVTFYFVVRPIHSLFFLPSADFYYLHEYRLYPTLWLSMKINPTPFIYDAHDFYPDVEAVSAKSLFWQNVFQPLLEFMERRCIAASSHVVTVSEGVGSLIKQKYGVEPVVIGNNHDPRFDRPDVLTLREAAGIPREELLIVVVGNHKAGQSVEPLLRVVSHSQTRIHVAFVGRHYEEVEKIVLNLNICDRIHFVGAIYPESLVPTICDADVAAILYYAHSSNGMRILPNGFFQSISAGLPLIYPSLPELLSIIGDRKVGWLADPLSQESMTSALQAIIEVKTSLKAFGEEAHLLAQELEWQCNEKKLLKLLDTL